MKVRFEPERVGREMRDAPLVSARPPIDMLIGEVIGAVAARVPELKKICRVPRSPASLIFTVPPSRMVASLPTMPTCKPPVPETTVLEPVKSKVPAPIFWMRPPPNVRVPFTRTDPSPIDKVLVPELKPTLPVMVEFPEI